MTYFYGRYDPEQLRADDEYLEWLKKENKRLDDLYNRIEHDRLVQEYKDKKRALAEKNKQLNYLPGVEF